MLQNVNFSSLYYMFKWSWEEFKFFTLAAQWLEGWFPVKRAYLVTGSIPGPSQWACTADNQLLFLSHIDVSRFPPLLPPLHSFSLSLKKKLIIEKNILGGGGVRINKKN